MAALAMRMDVIVALQRVADQLMRCFALLAFCGAIAQCAFVRAAAQPVSSAFAAYTHQRWGQERSAPKQIYAVAQGKDGFLWLATSQGLQRFDGIRFERVTSPQPDLDGFPSAVLVTRQGDVWTNFSGSHRFAIYRSGRLRILPPSPVKHRVALMKEGPDGSIWVLSESEDDPLLRYVEGQWMVYGKAQGIPAGNPADLEITDNGTVWLTGAGAVFRLAPQSRRFKLAARTASGTARLSVDPAGRIWVSDGFGSYPITGAKGQGAPPGLRLPYATEKPQIRGFAMFDRSGNFWMTTEYRGVQRISRPDPRGAATQKEASAVVERFRAQDGLSSDITHRLIQDVEGNVWVGTEKGIDRFRAASVVTEPRLDDPHVFGDLLLAASDGSVFIAQASTVYRVMPGGRPREIMRSRTRPSTLCEAPNGDIWITLGNRLVIWRDGKVIRRKPDVPTDITIYDCAFDAQGDYWVSAARGGLLRLHVDQWERMFGATGPEFRPRSMISDQHGAVLAQWSNRKLRYVARSGRKVIAVPFAIDDPQAVTLYVPPSGVTPATLYVGGPQGVARRVGTKWQHLGMERVPGLANVNGIVITPKGEHWFTGSAGVVRIRASEVEAAFGRSGYTPRSELFDSDSGLPSMPHDHSRHAIVQGGDGRLWIAAQNGIAWIDPARLARNPFPPALSIRGVHAGQRHFRDPRKIRLDAGVADVEIDFAVLSLSNPDRTVAKYTMEGQDRGWIEAGSRREVFYTNLSPGTYRFRVIAENEDGVRNAKGASVEIEVVPTFVQSVWFLVLLALAAVLILWLLLHLRSIQVAARMRSRLEQRLIERETIARDLHDSLLQGVQGVMFRIQAVAHQLVPESKERDALEQALDQTDELVAKGRESVRDLRMRGGEEDLRRALQEAVSDALFDDGVDVQVVELGAPRKIHPLAMKEIKAIVGEALFNVGRHAAAREVELVASYGRRTFRLRIQDDGRGIPANVLESGQREGHFGLVGMRERAGMIGGQLSLRSQEGEGTEVLIEISGAVAYERDSRRWSWLARFLPG